MQCDVMAPQKAAFTISGTDDHRQARKTHDTVRLRDTRYLRLSPRGRRCFCLLVCPRLPTLQHTQSLTHPLTALHTKATYLCIPQPPTTSITHRHQDTLIRNCSPEFSGSCTRCLGPRPHAAESRSPQRGPSTECAFETCVAGSLPPSLSVGRPKSLNSLSTQASRAGRY
jgi:hypothetical protein